MKPVMGFIGLGIMGRPMVIHLLEAGYKVHIYNRSHAAMQQALSAGAVLEASPAAVAQAADVTITIVSDTPDVLDVIAGNEGVIHSLTSGKIVIDMSTISPEVTRGLAQLIVQTGAHMLDAPVSGGEKGALEATLSIMVGGEVEIYEKCLPIFRTLGRNIVHVGQNSFGQVVKACNQVLAASTLAAMGEALALGTKAGVEPGKIVEVLTMGAARCWALEVRAPHVLNRNFQPGFKAKLQYKDLGLAMELSRQMSIPMPIAAQVHEMYKSIITLGYGEEDHSAVVRYIELMAKVVIANTEINEFL